MLFLVLLYCYSVVFMNTELGFHMHFNSTLLLSVA